MSLIRSALIALATTIAAPLAFAQGPLDFITLERDAEIEAFVRFGDQPDDCADTDDNKDFDESQLIGFYTFEDNITAAGSNGSARAAATTESTARFDGIDISGEVTAEAALGSACSTSAVASIDLTTTFTVDRIVSASLVGRIAAELPNGADTSAYNPFAIVTLVGFSPTGGFLNVTYQIGAFTGQLERDIFEPITLFPDAEYALAIGGGMTVGVDDAGGPTSAPEAKTTINLALDLGDRDGDGLLDEWETVGIDFDNDGSPELDLPAMGADPDRKDLFIEIDVMQGFTPNAGSLADVRDAFANVPFGLITNPDGSTGITLHTIIDETSLPVTQYAARPNHYTTVTAIKDQFFGTPAERSSPDWPLIKEARLASFRYCIWGGTRAGDRALGFGEILGDDFTVLAGQFGTGDTRDLQAGTFMHEFGHNLGLRHGGDVDTNFNPNYISIMNYALAVPRDNFPAELKDTWRLDYSARELPLIDESDFFESDGYGLLGSPELAGRFTLVRFPFTNSDGNPDVRSLAAPLDQSPFDITGDGDTNDFGMVDVNADGSLDVLEGFNDWRAINLPLRGSDNFGDADFGIGEDTDDMPGGVIDLNILDTIASQFDSPTTPCNIADLAAPFGITDLDDVDTFVIAFLASGPAADLVPPQGIIDLADVDAFINAFLAGCP